jgi:hypothetical protein
MTSRLPEGCCPTVAKNVLKQRHKTMIIESEKIIQKLYNMCLTSEIKEINLGCSH